MFRKPKRKGKTSIRKKDDEETRDNDAGAEETTRELLQEARKRVKTSTTTTASSASNKQQADLMQSFETTDPLNTRDLVTSAAEHHPDDDLANKAAAVKDGIFRNPKNKFHAGPIKAPTNVRITARFDYQPDVCKDYKETGFCGYGDTCIYMHDRGDTVSGWQLEQQYEQEQQRKRETQEKELQAFASGKQDDDDNDDSSKNVVTIDDGIPFACHVCRSYFRNPVVTNCQHYFCESCIFSHVRTSSEACPVCGKDTGNVFNQPVKLIHKKRKILRAKKNAKDDDDSWEEYFKVFQATQKSETVVS